MPETEKPESNLTIRLDSKRKKEFSELCKRLGLTMNGAIDMFIVATLRTGRLPFRVVDPLKKSKPKEVADK